MGFLNQMGSVLYFRFLLSGNANLFIKRLVQLNNNVTPNSKPPSKPMTLPRLADGEAQDNSHLHSLASSGAIQRPRIPGKTVAGKWLSTLL